MDSDEIEAEVNLTRAALKFDFRQGDRDGLNNRLLVFRATKAKPKENTVQTIYNFIFISCNCSSTLM